MTIGECWHKGHKIEVSNINGRYFIFDNNKMTHKELTPDDFVRWACNALEDNSEKKE